MKQYSEYTYNGLKKGCNNRYEKQIKKRRIRIDVLQ